MPGTPYSSSKKYFNRNDSSFPMDPASFSSATSKWSGLSHALGSRRNSWRGSRRAVLPLLQPPFPVLLPIRLPPGFNFTGFRGISTERSVLVLSLLASPARFFRVVVFFSPPLPVRNNAPRDSPAFAESRRAFRAGRDDTGFSLGLRNLWCVANFDWSR